VSQKGKTNLDFTEARDSEWQWYQLGHMQVCTLLQTDNHTGTPPLSFFTGRMPFVPPNQQRQSTEGKKCTIFSFLAGLNTRPATMLPQALQSAGDGDTSPLLHPQSIWHLTVWSSFFKYDHLATLPKTISQHISSYY